MMKSNFASLFGCNREILLIKIYAGISKILKKVHHLLKLRASNKSINLFLANVPILYPVKTPENFWFSGVFMGYKMGTLARNGLS